MKPAVLISILGALLSVATAAAVPAADHAAGNHYLETRAKKPAKKPPPPVKPPPDSKPPVKPNPTPSKPNPTPGRPSPTPGKPSPTPDKPSPTPGKPSPTPDKPSPTPGKPSSTPSKPTSTQKSTTTPTPSKLPAGKTCKQIALLRQQEEPDDEAISTRPRSPRSALSKRAFKGSLGAQGPCKVPKFISGIYESFGKEKVQNPNAPIYGWKNLEVCTDLGWYKGDTSPALKNTIKLFQTEHVLEWQTIEEFFGPYLEKHFEKTQFTSPDPKDETGGVRAKTDWCGVWSKTWAFTGQDQFALKEGGPEKTPFQWIADVYPSKYNYRNEFTLLQRGSNSVKGRLFNNNDIFSDKDKTENRKTKKGMVSLVRDEPKLAIARLRDVVGARKYLGDPKVRKFMADVKIRLQDRFDEIEKALEKPENRREITSTRGGAGATRKVDVWKKQDLGKLWDVFMNNKWADARNKQQKFMEKWILQIKNKYCTAAMIKALPQNKSQDTPQQKERRETCDAYNAVVRGWKDAQMSPFTAPWTAVRDPAGDRHTPPTQSP